MHYSSGTSLVYLKGTRPLAQNFDFFTGNFPRGYIFWHKGYVNNRNGNNNYSVS